MISKESRSEKQQRTCSKSSMADIFSLVLQVVWSPCSEDRDEDQETRRLGAHAVPGNSKATECQLNQRIG